MPQGIQPANDEMLFISIQWMATKSSVQCSQQRVMEASDVTAGGMQVCPVELAQTSDSSSLSPVIEKHEAAFLSLLGFCGFSVLLSIGYNVLRKYVFKDQHNLDTVFDAGGRVSFSLTAVTVTSQVLWPSDFLQSTTVLTKSGIGGALWFPLGIVVSTLLFPILCLQLKCIAPGAKTFPQIVYARFGTAPHIVYCVVALATNLVVTTNLLLAGKTTIDVLTKDVNNEFIMIVLAVLFGSYCLIGGLGTTFYMSYFNTAFTFLSVSIYLIYTQYRPASDIKQYTSSEAMYNAMRCVKGPDGNFGNSLLTFRSRYGLIYGIVILFIATSSGFTDQANWQSRIAAKPKESVLGFFVAAYLWFALPTSISFTAAMTYISMSYKNGTHLLPTSAIDNGYITPFVFKSLLGKTGGCLMLSMIMMALMSTGSGEIMSASSLLVYDIYKTYIKPFRKNLPPTSCLLCGKENPNQASDVSRNDATCHCPSAINCEACADDIKLRMSGKSLFGLKYSCAIHGMYRHYEDQLIRYKSWCMISIVICILPYGLLVVESGINLNWGVYFGTTQTSPFLIPIVLTLSWSKCTGKGIITGGIIGVICCMFGIFIMASTYENGMSDFFTNTTQDLSLLVGLVSGIVSSSVLSIGVSLCTHNISSQEDVNKEWEKTMSIDNPLKPFRMIYEEELEEMGVGSIITVSTMAKLTKSTKRVALIGGVLSISLFVVIIPAVALSYDELNFDEFSAWLNFCQIWCLIGTVLVVVVPPFQEGLQIWRQYQSIKIPGNKDWRNARENEETEMCNA